jgi:hypothetical protein
MVFLLSFLSATSIVLIEANKPKWGKGIGARKCFGQRRLVWPRKKVSSE